jgi:hypothetical protein
MVFSGGSEPPAAAAAAACVGVDVADGEVVALADSVGVEEDVEEELVEVAVADDEVDSVESSRNCSSFELASSQLFCRALYMQSTSSAFPPAITTVPSDPWARAKLLLVTFGANVELYAGQLLMVRGSAPPRRPPPDGGGIRDGHAGAVVQHCPLDLVWRHGHVEGDEVLGSVIARHQDGLHRRRVLRQRRGQRCSRVDPRALAGVEQHDPRVLRAPADHDGLAGRPRQQDRAEPWRRERGIQASEDRVWCRRADGKGFL